MDLSNHSASQVQNTSVFNSSSKQVPFKESTLVEVLSKPDALTISLFLVLLTLLSVGGNALVCRTICVTRRLHFAGYYFVASLAVADFLVGVFVLPLSLLYHITFNMKGGWIFGEAVCDAWTLTTVWFCCASILSLCGVTWDRYVAVTSPLHYVSRMTDSHVIHIISTIWVTSLVIGVVNMYGFKTSTSRVLCELQRIPLLYSSFDFIFLYVLPLTLVFSVNYKIWKAALWQLRCIHAQIPVELPMQSNPNTQGNTNDISTSSANVTGSQVQQSAKKKLNQEIKTFRTFLIVIGSFFGSWTPFFFIILIDSFIKVSSTAAYVCGLLAYISSATNPLIYGIFNSDFRKALFKTF